MGDCRFFLRAGWALAALLATAAPAQNTAELADSEQAFKAAKAAAEAGDFPVAIAQLEHILLNNPNLANIKLELGLLYLRVGQADLARGYLEAAASAPDAPEAARIRAREALRQASGSLRRFSISGVVQAGMQYQSNPNGSPGSVSIVGPAGVPVVLSSDRLSITRGSDVSGSVSASSELRYGLGGQRGTDLVATLTGSYQRYVDQTQINTLYLGGQLGPRFRLGHVMAPTGFFRPFVEGTYLGLGGSEYFSSIGGGGALTYQLGPTAQFSGQASYSRRTYNNSTKRPTSTDQTGDYWSGSGDVLVQANAKTLVDFGLLGERGDARRGYWSRTTFGASIGAIRNIAVGKLGLIGRLSFAYRHSLYDDPDPLVDPNKRRRENRYELGAGLGVPLSQRLTLDMLVQHQWNPANLPNYDYRNLLGSMSLSYRY